MAVAFAAGRFEIQFIDVVGQNSILIAQRLNHRMQRAELFGVDVLEFGNLIGDHHWNDDIGNLIRLGAVLSQRTADCLNNVDHRIFRFREINRVDHRNVDSLGETPRVGDYAIGRADKRVENFPFRPAFFR